MFVPKREIDGDVIRDFANVEYVDIKYLWDVDFSSAQREITNNLPAVTSANIEMAIEGVSETVDALETITITKVFKLAPTMDMTLNLIAQ